MNTTIELRDRLKETVSTLDFGCRQKLVKIFLNTYANEKNNNKKSEQQKKTVKPILSHKMKMRSGYV